MEKIRLAKKGDGKELIGLLNEGFRKGFGVYNNNNFVYGTKDVRERNKKLAERGKNNFSFVAVDIATNEIVGECSFSTEKRGRIRHRGEVGWVVHPDYARRGIATRLLRAVLGEAKRRGFKKAGAEMAAAKIPSVRLAKKFGFKIEGKRRAGLRLDSGKYVDTYVFGKILR